MAAYPDRHPSSRNKKTGGHVWVVRALEPEGCHGQDSFCYSDVDCCITFAAEALRPAPKKKWSETVTDWAADVPSTQAALLRLPWATLRDMQMCLSLHGPQTPMNSRGTEVDSRFSSWRSVYTHADSHLGLLQLSTELEKISSCAVVRRRTPGGKTSLGATVTTAP